MADFLLALGAIALLVAAMIAIWRRVAGPARSRLAAGARLLLAVVIAVVLVSAGTYRLTKSRTFQLGGTLVDRVETKQKVIALTFDDGPTAEHTGEVLSVLARYDVHATFYLTGAESAAEPEQVRRIVDAGHELGNHTYAHTRLVFVPGSKVADELDRTDAVFRAAGYEGPITFRPPGCKRLLTAPLVLAEKDLTTVTWDLEPDSLEALADDPQAMSDHVLESARPGSIVLMHVMYDSREASREALPDIIERLAADGYRFVTISELQELAGR